MANYNKVHQMNSKGRGQLEVAEKYLTQNQCLSTNMMISSWIFLNPLMNIPII